MKTLFFFLTILFASTLIFGQQVVEFRVSYVLSNLDDADPLPGTGLNDLGDSDPRWDVLVDDGTTPVQGSVNYPEYNCVLDKTPNEIVYTKNFPCGTTPPSSFDLSWRAFEDDGGGLYDNETFPSNAFSAITNINLNQLQGSNFGLWTQVLDDAVNTGVYGSCATAGVIIWKIKVEARLTSINHQVSLVSRTQPTQSGQTGSATISISGGTGTSFNYSNASGSISGSWTQAPYVINNLPVGNHTIFITDPNNNCSSQVYIKICMAPVASFSFVESEGNTNDGVICTQGASVQLQANTSGGANAWVWSTGSQSSSISVNPTQTTPYTVTITNTNTGCFNVFTDEVEYIPATAGILINETSELIDHDGTICENETVELEATGGTSYVWSTSATTHKINESPSSQTTYAVTATNQYGCTDDAQETIDVTPSPTVSIQALETSGHTDDDGLICSGDQVDLLANPSPAPSGSISYTYAWGGGLGSNNPLTGLSPSATNQYQVTVEDQNDCVGAGSIQITVNALPTGSISAIETSGNNANDGVICAGDAITLQAPTGTSFTYNWSTNESTSSISPSLLQSNNFTCKVTNSDGCSVILSYYVTVNSLPTPSITISETSGNQNNDGIVCSGALVTLTTPSVGTNTYQWSVGGSGNQLTTSITTLGANSISVTETNSNGCQQVDDISITVLSNPSASIVIQENSGTTQDDGIICDGDNVDLTANGGGDYLWSTGANTALISPSPSSTTSYSVTVTDGNGCSDTETELITVNPIPNNPTIPPASFCEEEGKTFDDVDNTVDWFDSGMIPITSSSTIPVNAGQPVTYFYSTTSNGCTSSTGSVVLTIFPTPTAPSIASNHSYCVDDNLSFADIHSSASWYTCDPNNGCTNTVSGTIPQGTATYWAVIIDANGCMSTSVNCTISIHQNPNVSLQLPFTDVCEATGPIPLSGGAPVGSPSNAGYTGPGVSLSNGQFYFDPNAVGAGTHTIDYIYTDPSTGCGNVASDQIIVDNQYQLWPKQMEALNATTHGISVDQSDVRYVCGSFEGTLQLGAFTLESSGGKDGFVARYDDCGVIWARRISTPLDDEALSIKVDQDGSGLLFIGGYVNVLGTAPVEVGDLAQNVYSSFVGTVNYGSQKERGFLIQMDGTDGTLVKADLVDYAHTASGNNRINAVAFSRSYFNGKSLVFVAGDFDGSLRFEKSSPVSSSGSTDGFVGVFDIATGIVKRGSFTMGTAGPESVTDLDCFAEYYNNSPIQPVYIGYHVAVTLDIDGSQSTYNMNNLASTINTHMTGSGLMGKEDGAVHVFRIMENFSPQEYLFQPVFGQSFGGPENDEANTVRFDPIQTNEILVGGAFEVSASIGQYGPNQQTVTTSPATPNHKDAFLASINWSIGELVFHDAHGGVNDQTIKRVEFGISDIALLGEDVITPGSDETIWLDSYDPSNPGFSPTATSSSMGSIQVARDLDVGITDIAAYVGSFTDDITFNSGYTFVCGAAQNQNGFASLYDVQSSQFSNKWAEQGAEDLQSEELNALVYPNPTNDLLNLQFPEEVNGEVQLYDLMGKMIMTRPLNATMQEQLDLRSLTSGVYMLRMQVNGSLETHQIVKQ